jgi:uncharacterized protein (TIGR02118 family)
LGGSHDIDAGGTKTGEVKLMIKVSVLYPSGAGKTFDTAYYCNKHIPMVRQLLGAALKGVGVEQGIAGGERARAVSCHRTPIV